MTSQEMFQSLMNNTQEIGKKAGYTFPDDLRDPQAIVMHLIQTGQVNMPMMQRIMPMIQKLNGR